MKTVENDLEKDQPYDAESSIIEMKDDRITSMIQTHNALATALEIKNALHTLILQMDETLAFKLEIQRKYANLKSRHNQLAERVQELEELIGEEEYEVLENSQSNPVKGKPLKVV